MFKSLLRELINSAFSNEELARVLHWNAPMISEEMPSATVSKKAFMDSFMKALDSNSSEIQEEIPKLLMVLLTERPRRKTEIQAIIKEFENE